MANELDEAALSEIEAQKKVPEDGMLDERGVFHPWIHECSICNGECRKIAKARAAIRSLRAEVERLRECQCCSRPAINHSCHLHTY